jgi:hypothetical protein
MFINFDLTSQSANSNGVQPPSKPKLSLFQRWINSVHDGYLKESLSSQKYCERVWIQQTGSPSPQATEVFMKTCITECIDYKQYCHWSRLN